MGSVFIFIYALFGVACACGLWRHAEKRGGRPSVAAWLVLALWYAIVGLGISFTWLNYAAFHVKASTVGAIITVAVALVLGLVVYRLATPGKIRSN